MAAAITACGTPSVELEEAFDLVAEFSSAEVLEETSDFEIGAERGRRHLASGWWGVEGKPADRFAWGLGDTSVLAFRVVGPRDLVLILDLRPFAYPASPSQTVSVEIAGQSISEFTLESKTRRRVSLPIGRQYLQAGLNQISLHWQWSRSPRETLGTRDSRSLAAALHGAWLCDPATERCGDDFKVESSESGPAVDQADKNPRRQGSQRQGPRGEDGRIWLPWGSSVDFFLEVPEGALLLADVAFRGEGGLEITTARDGDSSSDERVGYWQHETSDESEALRWQVSSDPGVIRLRFSALGVRHRGGVRIEQPRIVRAVDPSVSKDSISTGSAGAAESSTSQSQILDPARVSEAPDSPTGLVLYSIDTLRADRLGYRGGVVETPVFDAFADESLVFENLTAQSSWTRASMASIFTGLWPPSHGAVNRRNRLEARVVTMAEMLHASGWATAAIITNPNVNELFGFDQGFEHFEYLGEELPAHEVSRAVERLLEARRGDSRPLFLWVHTVDPHSPYNPPPEFRRQRLPDISDKFAESSLDIVNALRKRRQPVEPELMDQLLGLYHAEIAYADEAFDDFLNLLGRHGLEDAVITVISDHGEEFMEHGNLEHGRALFVESLDVPWMIRGPGISPQRLSQPAQHLDVAPTLLSRLGLSLPDGLEGHAWLGSDGSIQIPGGPRFIYSHLHLDGDEHLSVSDGSFKLMVVVKRGELVRRRLFDRREDPLETMNVIDQHPVLVGRFVSLLRQRLQGAMAEPGAEVVFDEETRRSLEALGYL